MDFHESFFLKLLSARVPMSAQFEEKKTNVLKDVENYIFGFDYHLCIFISEDPLIG